MGAVFKWLAGIAASILAGLILWHLTNQSAPTPVSGDDADETPSAAAVCHIAGTVYDRDTNQPLAGIEVHYFRRTRDPNEWIHRVRSRLAVTGADGRFSADCASVEPENFPLRLELVSGDWGGTFQTDEYVRQGQRREDVNIYVSDRLLREL